MHQFLNIDIISIFRCLHLQLALSLKSEIYFLDLLHTNKHQCQFLDRVILDLYIFKAFNISFYNFKGILLAFI